MKYNSILKVLPVIVLLIALTFSLDSLAGPPGGGGGGNPGCATPPCIPIDGGLSILLAAGVALGGKKLHDHLKG